MNATPTKLRNGTWGARTTDNVSKGDVVTITTRGGKSWDATVTEIVWSGDGVTIVATQSAPRAARPSYQRAPRRASYRRGWTGCACGSIEDNPRNSDCFTCQNDY